ncbi:MULTISPECIES: enoyl-CoA hydratase-related protein [Thermocrispum]|uniref:Enoyl-CoA hydratase-related protein n=1 Tax=Thermocrispum agreste TaxID=37925 RepID=A0ABD6FIN2_9PSEU|nr:MULTISPECIES: enoyl-CoA hydratase-related protein [Thermocrispum]
MSTVHDQAAGEVLITSDQAGVRTITLNRPQAYNALNVELKEALRDALVAAAAAEDVRAVVLTGAGKAFCAGQDLKEHIALLDAQDPAPLRTVEEHYNPIVRALATMPKPTVAAVNGSAAGAGAAFSYACDLRVAGRSASFTGAFAGVGLGPDSGASWTLQRLVGFGRAMELMMLGRKVGADEALRIGLVNEVVDDDAVLSRAQELAAQLAAGPTAAYREIRQVLIAASTSTLDEALENEKAAQTRLGATHDHREAVDAFVNKRRPRFTGK